MDATIFLILCVFGAISLLVEYVKNRKRKKIEKEQNRICAYDELNNKELPWPLLRAHMRTVRDDKCEKCGGSWRLQVHHKVPVSAGGDNSYNNLVLLCQECHEKIHHVFEKGGFDKDNSLSKEREFKDMPVDYGQTKIRTKRSIIDEAIISERDITIRYKKYADTECITRRITPKELYLKNDNVYLKAYCHLRSDNRVFKLSRIQHVEIV